MSTIDDSVRSSSPTPGPAPKPDASLLTGAEAGLGHLLRFGTPVLSATPRGRSVLQVLHLAQGAVAATAAAPDGKRLKVGSNLVMAIVGATMGALRDATSETHFKTLADGTQLDRPVPKADVRKLARERLNGDLGLLKYLQLDSTMQALIKQEMLGEAIDLIDQNGGKAPHTLRWLARGFSNTDQRRAVEAHGHLQEEAQRAASPFGAGGLPGFSTHASDGSPLEVPVPVSVLFAAAAVRLKGDMPDALFQTIPSGLRQAVTERMIDLAVAHRVQNGEDHPGLGRLSATERAQVAERITAAQQG